MNINTPIEYIPKVGNVFKARLNRLNIFTIEDLLWHVPFRYEDSSKISLIKDITSEFESQNFTVKGKVVEVKNTYTKYGKNLTNAIIEDSSGMADVIWFNQTYLTKNLLVGNDVLIYGKIEHNFYRPKFISPEYEIMKNNETPVHLARIVGIYPETKGVSSKWIRFLIKSIIDKVETPFKDVFRKLHFPNNFEEIEEAKNILAFQEMLDIQLKILKRKLEREKKLSFYIKIDRKLHENFLENIPFKLTLDQETSIEDIFQDIQKEVPMNRLLEGDVGSGKTVVAASAALQTLNNAKKVIFLAPTSILAMQHYITLKQFIPEDSLGLVTSKHKTKNDLNKQMLIGTHALLFQKENLDNIGLVIIDEQHRFGVEQREELENLEPFPHVLSMSATPIPRTLAMALYADIDISIIKTKPEKRKEIATYLVPQSKREDSYNFIRNAIKERREQIYIICPLIEESEKVEAKSAKLEYERLKTEVFPELDIGLLHGQIKAKEKDLILEDFKNKKYDILVSTSVIEVGIDIPNATIIVIEGAEKFGLAQLHQLRGRVGRSDKQSYCFLFTTSDNNLSNQRLKMFCRSNDGIQLAEFDLEQRGPGEVYGTRQTGLPQIRIARFNDIQLIEQAKKEAEKILSIEKS